MYRFCALVCVALLFKIISGGHLDVVQVITPSTTEFVSEKSGPEHGHFFLSSEDLSDVDVSDDHPPSIMTATDMKDLTSHAEMISDNSTELAGNFTTETTTFEYHHDTETEGPVDLTVTDATGCLTALRDQMEEKCFDKFQEVVIGVMGDPENKRVVCCELEDYEKCSLRGYIKTHCEGDRQSLKESLKAARLFMAAISNVSCSEHRGRCDSAASVYTPSFVSVLMGLVALFFFL